MYHPYFRGKQYELVCIRENAELMKAGGIVPIIEPVKESLGGLRRALEAVSEAKGKAVVITNPEHGDLAGRAEDVVKRLKQEIGTLAGISYALALRETHSVDQVLSSCRALGSEPITLLHSGFTNGGALADAIKAIDVAQHVFVEPKCGKLYRAHFKGARRILLRDGFKKRANKDYPSSELFSDLHITFEEEGMNGFGDYLVVGDEYSETGGPAYAVAIHLTYIDPERDKAMYVFHFKSDRMDTPLDPAGKFLEALGYLVAEAERRGTHLHRTAALKEFLALHYAGHFPGLGHVKKLSMAHHIETLAQFIDAGRR